MAKLQSTKVYGNINVDNTLKVTGSIEGPGTGITDISANNISTGTINQSRLPKASETVSGTAKMYVSGSTLYITTT